MKLRLAALALLPLALSACNESTMADFQRGLGMTPKVEEPTEPLYTGPPSVSPLEQPIELAGSAAVAVATAESETLNTAAFSARGNEPFWMVDVAEGNATYRTPERQSGRNIAVRRIVFASGVEYIGELNGQAFALTIRSTNCVDSMSGEKFPMSATLKVGGQTNSGCAAAAGKMSPPPAASPAAGAPATTAAVSG